MRVIFFLLSDLITYHKTWIKPNSFGFKELENFSKKLYKLWRVNSKKKLKKLMGYNSLAG